jgi:hypothetical protein
MVAPTEGTKQAEERKTGEEETKGEGYSAVAAARAAEKV